MTRIDRFLLSEGFITRWKVKAQWIGDSDIFDHCLVWLVSLELKWDPKPVKFNNCCLDHEDFMKFGQECWSSFHVEGRHSYAIKEKMRLLKETLRWLNKEVFGFKDLHVEKIVKELNEVERVAIEGGPPRAELRIALSTEFW